MESIIFKRHELDLTLTISFDCSNRSNIRALNRELTHTEHHKLHNGCKPLSVGALCNLIGCLWTETYEQTTSPSFANIKFVFLQSIDGG